MERKVQWALVGLLAVIIAVAAFTTRYAYPERGAGMLRIDRWTGTPQRWGCVEVVKGEPSKPSQEDPYAAIFAPVRGADETGCLRYGWKPRA